MFDIFGCGCQQPVDHDAQWRALEQQMAHHQANVQRDIQTNHFQNLYFHSGDMPTFTPMENGKPGPKQIVYIEENLLGKQL